MKMGLEVVRMEYKELELLEIFVVIRTEEDARKWIWQSKYGGKDFICPHCGDERYCSLSTRPEVRKCAKCRRHIRIRVGTIFEHSKISLLAWVRSLGLMMQGKRGISAMELRRELGIKSYSTAWGLLHKIRAGLKQRDATYKLKGIVELDGAQFGKRRKYEHTTVLVAIESKDWTDERGRFKSRAGFAKVLMTYESARCAQKFADTVLETGTMVNVDGNNSYTKLKNFDVDSQIVSGDPEILNRWLPWVHKFISNSKAWILGTHHGVGHKNIGKYLAEYAYRFNRRHTPKTLFHRALTACCLAKPVPLGALSG